MFDEDILDLFREESQEHLSSLESSLLDLESTEDTESRRRMIDDAFRHAHSIKGSARAVGLIGIQDLGQVLEDTLDAIRENPDAAGPEIISRAMDEFDALRIAFEQWEQGSDSNSHDSANPSLETQRESATHDRHQDIQPAVENQPADSLLQSQPTVDVVESAISMDDDILKLFLEESRELVSGLAASLLELEQADDAGQQRRTIDTVFRYAHTIKGSARAVGLDAIQNSAQELEDTLDEFREDPDNVTRQGIDQALSEFEALNQAFQHWQLQHASAVQTTPETHPASEDRQATPSSRLSPSPDSLPKDIASMTPGEPSEKPGRGKAGEERFVVRVPAERLDRMLSLAGEIRVSQRGSDAFETQLAIINDLVTETLASWKRLEDKQVRLDSGNSNALREPATQLRLQMESAVKRLRQLQSDFGKKRFREELLVEELEQDIRTARLVPLANLTDSMRRAVRDLAKSLGKTFAYQADVGSILLDKGVMEALKDPLMHMIRNAADHGIESPEERVAAGKPEAGTIAITASRRADNVLIRICDDGSGINFDRIREKLKSSGHDDAEIAALSEKELARFLFQAGFSTKQQVTAVSGRGVGMDVVMDSIHRLQGTVELETSSPAGSVFLITVPVTISTARILTVTSGGQRYGIPTISMERTGRLNEKSLKDIEGSLILTIDKSPVRWIDLADLLDVPATRPSGNGDFRAYLLLNHEGRKLALAVDEFEDESEVILKPLEFPLTDADEVIGGTIRPDGSAQLVLDPAWLMSKALRVHRRIAPAEIKVAPRILVVDDSPTTRSIMRQVLSQAGYVVQTAADGVDAMEMLRSHPFELVVSDVEMPRMNGFELTRQVKAQFNLPLILVTGLEKDDDRRQGLQAGADAYVVKSTFAGDSLLEIISQLV